MTIRSKALGVCAAVLMLTGCSKKQTADETAAQPPATTQGAEVSSTTGRVVLPRPGSAGAKEIADSKPTPPLSDSEIVQITAVVNRGEIDQARIAQDKAETPQVKQFAEHMIADHGRAEQEGARIVKREGLIPEESSAATELSNDAASTLETLRSAQPGAGFDALYMDGQIVQHAKVLDLLDTQLIPSAESPALRAELERTRGMVARHLADAQQINGSLSPVE